MKYWKLLYLLIGFALLGLILQQTNLQEVWRRVTHVGWWGMSVVLGIYFLSYLSDVCAWQLTFETIPLNLRWLYRLFLVRLVGEAFNDITPLASMGGEPLKAILLKTHYRIGYRESGTSLILAKTLDLISLVVFLYIGFLLLLTSDKLPAAFKTGTGLGLVAFSTCIGLFFLVQRFKLISLVSRLLDRSGLGNRLSGLLGLLRDTDEQLVRFYSRRPRHLRKAFAVAFINWPLGVLEVYFLMAFLENPIAIADAWIIEAVVQLVRAGTFFIPVGIGTQEGIFVLVCSAIAGDPSLGLAMALARRFREILWMLWGLAIWRLFLWEPTSANK